MSARTLTVLAVLLFAITVTVRAPARWLVAAAPHAAACDSPSGSMWSGGCAQLRAAGVALAGFSWKLHFLPLLRGHLDVDLKSADPRAPGTARVSFGVNQRIVLSDVRADLPVDSGFLPVLPDGWSGQVQLALEKVEFGAGRLASIQGTATARSLAQRSPALSFGSYELRFGDAARAAGSASGAQQAVITGNLRDLGGPMAVTGTLTIRNGNEYELAGLVATRPEANAELAKSVEFLGPVDADGRRPFSLAGSF